MRVTADHVTQLLQYLSRRDTSGAVALALRLADEGVPVVDVLTELIAPAQAEFGHRWHRNDISVADEHAATAIVEAVVSVLTATTQPLHSAPHVVVLCAEGEWHLLPARLVAEGLRAEGCTVTFLGGSMPPAHLTRFLDRSGADVVAISCSTPLAYRGLLACTHVAHDLGLPVIAGGLALGDDERRAAILGADLWARDVRHAARVLRSPLPTTRNEPTADTGTAMALTLVRHDLVAAAMERLVALMPAVGGYSGEQLARTREDFDYILQFAEAAILVADPGVFTEFLLWLDVLLQARGLPASVLPVSLDALAGAAIDHVALAELLDEGRRSLEAHQTRAGPPT